MGNGKGRVALISGASRGVGREIAVALAREGYHLALLARSTLALEETARLCRAEGVKALPLSADVNEITRLESVVASVVEKLGGLDVLVNNAGVSHAVDAFHADRETWDAILDTNLRSVMHLSRLCLPSLARSDRGSVIFISSQAAHLDGVPGMAPYFATKHALRGFADSLFEEVRDRNIRVSCICPGLVNTALGVELRREYPDLLDIAPSDMLQPEDVARATRYILASSATCCPTEVLLEPMKIAVPEVRKSVEPPGNEPGIKLHAPDRPVALVTGASRGIGRAMAETLAGRGYHLALLGRSVDDLEETAESCRQAGVEAVSHAFDIADTDALEAAVNSSVTALGNLQVVVSNAGISRRKSALGTNRKVWDRVIHTNLLSAMHLARVTLPFLHRNPGRAVLAFVSSAAVQARFGMPGIAPYVASKYGLEGFATSVFSDVCEYGIKITSLCPALTNTELGRRPGPIEYAVTPETMIQPEDVADALGYVLDSGPTACPTRFLLHSQRHAFRFKQAAAERIDKPSFTT